MTSVARRFLQGPDFRRLLASCQAFRQDLHMHPEVSGEEEATAARVVDFMNR